MIKEYIYLIKLIENRKKKLKNKELIIKYDELLFNLYTKLSKKIEEGNKSSM